MNNGSEARAVYERICEIEKELREISTRFGAEIRIQTYLARSGDYKGQAASEAYIGKACRHDHYFDGREELTDGKHRTLRPEEIRMQAGTA